MGLFSVEIEQLGGNYINIKHFPAMVFLRDLKRRYKTSRLMNMFYIKKKLFSGYNLTIHEFYLPELLFMLSSLPYRRAYKELTYEVLAKTWMDSTVKNFPSIVNIDKIKNDMNFNLKPYQEDFVKLYDDRKQKYNLNGYILAFEQGLGKTFTSLALMHGMNKNKVIIIAPKSTLRSVWSNEIKTVFKDEQDVWIVGDKPRNAKYFILNYESLDKVSQIIPYVLNSNTGIIIDESHNFRSKEAKRVIRVISFSKITKCKDILLLSGTPIKALGSEMIPTLQIIDPLFDDNARDSFAKIFGLSSPIALEILKNRLGLMMYRKMKSEVLNLPEKHSYDIKIKISDGNEYTLENVKEKVRLFIEEREKFYKINFEKYNQDFNEAIKYVSPKLKRSKDFDLYLGIIKHFRNHVYSNQNPDDIQKGRWANEYEKSNIIPLLPSDLKKRFVYAKSVIKYIALKIMGEVIGGLLNKLRSEMFRKMIPASPLIDIINKSEKKTLCFTTFTDVVETTADYVRKQKFTPALVYGKTNANIKSILDEFKQNEKINPMIATIQSLATGVTITEANTVVFLNKPWRITDYEQAYSRVHRIGQDCDVDIFNFSLDTGGKDNLSTRMEDIVNWSKEMFEGIVGEL
jgi:SNF2 family DNA or RNA helicase